MTLILICETLDKMSINFIGQCQVLKAQDIKFLALRDFFWIFFVHDEIK